VPVTKKTILSTR